MPLPCFQVNSDGTVSTEWWICKRLRTGHSLGHGRNSQESWNVSTAQRTLWQVCRNHYCITLRQN